MRSLIYIKISGCISERIVHFAILHNHLDNVSISIVKHKIKDKIRKSSILLGIKPELIFNGIYININKQLLHITKFVDNGPRNDIVEL
ncbi:hypothetical protein H8356DRAFT_1322205 [Neocallimastix lanati (nom. inval.)]|nr:hypothetical protein H8356DRAFT_1322205 [Neocallimastix sp. JGI-2020a]